MAKSQKKSATLNEQSSITRNPDKGAVKPPVKEKAPQSKAVKRIVDKSEKPAGDSKQSIILALLQRPSGATIDEMAKATGWQRHSVHGMMSGVLKKKLGLTVTSDKEERGRVYRITGSVSRL